MLVQPAGLGVTGNLPATPSEPVDRLDLPVGQRRRTRQYKPLRRRPVENAILDLGV